MQPTKTKNITTGLWDRQSDDPLVLEYSRYRKELREELGIRSSGSFPCFVAGYKYAERLFAAKLQAAEKHEIGARELYDNLSGEHYYEPDDLAKIKSALQAAEKRGRQQLVQEYIEQARVIGKPLAGHWIARLAVLEQEQ